VEVERVVNSRVDCRYGEGRDGSNEGDVADQSLVEDRAHACWVSHMLQRLVAQLMSDPGTKQDVARAAELYASRRRAMFEAVSDFGTGTRTG
jgi:hypothetical protein